ncbi:fungal-specific transcription factor domain-containing protein [Mycena amicta]|nr:fungal-specific transcription factor domain-containing protein [Mycena amicta]
MDDTSTPGAGPSSASSGLPVPRKSQITSCAECRRLKLRCDRIFPCASCIRRGCAVLCPSGTLEKGKRGFLKRLEQSLPSAKPGAEQEQSEVAMFVARDAAMNKRIQELEHALTSAGVPIPGTAPPIADAMPYEGGESRAKRPRTVSNSDPPTHSVPSDPMDVALGFGTLTIDVDKRSRYVGPSGGAAYLWKGQTHSRRSSEDNSASPASHGLTDSSANRSVSPQQMAIFAKMSCLPRHDEAVRIARIYFTNASFMYEVIPENIFFHNHLPTIYPDRGNPYAPTNLHILSLFSMVLAVGTYFDLSHSPDVVRPIAARYYDLAVAALNITIPLKLDTIPAVQTLHLMALYFLSTQGESGGEPAWQVLGMAMRSVQAQGCHRDGSRWGLPQQDLEERRRVFWETHMYDRIQSFTLGRPYSQSDAHHDCEMPQTCDTPLPSDSDPTNSSFSHTRWHIHKFHFARILGRIADLVFSAKGPTYAVILDLDREINESYASLPAWMLSEAVKNPIKELPAHALASDADLRRNAQIASLANMYFLTLLHLHRGPFCRALMLGPKNLATSKYKTSVESLIRAARAIIDNARGLFSLHPAMLSRMWYFIFHTFTATVCLAVLVIIAPSHALAPAAFESMQAAIELFDRASSEGATVAAERSKSLAARARHEMENVRRGSADNVAMQQEPVPHARDQAALGRLEFPTSNMRGNPDDLLGTSTKLIRAQQPLSDGLPASPNPPLAMPASLAQHHPSPISGNNRFAFETAMDAGYQRPATQEGWGPQAGPTPPMSMDWDSNYVTSYGVQRAMSSQQPHPQGHRTSSHAIHLQPPQPYPQQTFDPSPYLSHDGFDVSGFIQSGAQSWMAYERAATDADGESDVGLHSWHATRGV